MNLAIVHEWLNVFGGSEKLLAEILALYPRAELHALIHNPRNLRGTPLESRAVTTTFLQKIPRVEHLYRGLLPLMPLAIESLDVHDHRVVLSISHAVAHGAKTSPNQTHISYICTPMRYAWHLQDDYLRLHHLDKPLIGLAARVTLGALRRWDASAASRADHLLAISAWTAARIRAAWGREARVIHPPVDIDRFDFSKPREDFYLVVSRLVPYKMTALVVEAFNRLKLPLLVVGDGPELPRLQKMAGETVQLLGHQPDEVVEDLMSRARAFLHIAVEDFGIAMVEAQAAGCPVIAFAKGGAAEIVKDGETGMLVESQSVEALIEAASRVGSGMKRWDASAMRANASRFSRQRFREEFAAFMRPFLDAS
jgi:glycosyltransferase involved in cell wall biosynthesis